MDIIKLHRKTSMMNNKVINLFQEIMSISLREAKIYALFEPINQILTSLLLLGTFGMGTYLISLGRLTLASFSVFIIILMQAIPAGKSIIQFGIYLKRAEALSKPVVDLLKIEDDIEDKYYQMNSSDNKLISLTDVSFTFEKDEILSNIFLDLYKNETVAIVGPSGSGKTTLLKIISGLYKSYEGNIERVPGLKFSYSTQESTLFKNKVEDNLEKDGGLVKNISIDKSIDELSGGEKQKVNLERAFLECHDILVLDEPTNNLDKHAVEEVLNRIEEEQKNKTSIILITHDINITKVANKILFLDNGKITGIGTYTDLLSKHKKFRAFVNLEKQRTILST